MRYRMDLSYDGAPYCGWQIQPGSPSVQETVEQALGTLLREAIGVVGAGRTDTGVHATGYVAHFDFGGPVPPALADQSGGAACTGQESLDCALLRYKLNAILPGSISVSRIEPADGDFHARFSAVRRSYMYLLHRRKDPFMDGRSYFYAYPGLDFDAMNRAASHLLGTHDFSCFEKSGGDNKTSVCTVFSARWTPCSPLPSGEVADGGEPLYWRFDITADRFLRNMVRAIVGTLLETGRGRRTQEEFAALIGKASRSLAGESVPGHALYLTKVEY